MHALVKSNAPEHRLSSEGSLATDIGRLSKRDPKTLKRYLDPKYKPRMDALGVLLEIDVDTLVRRFGEVARVKRDLAPRSWEFDVDTRIESLAEVGQLSALLSLDELNGPTVMVCVGGDPRDQELVKSWICSHGIEIVACSELSELSELAPSRSVVEWTSPEPFHTTWLNSETALAVLCQCVESEQAPRPQRSRGRDYVGIYAREPDKNEQETPAPEFKIVYVSECGSLAEHISWAMGEEIIDEALYESSTASIEENPLYAAIWNAKLGLTESIGTFNALAYALSDEDLRPVEMLLKTMAREARNISDGALDLLIDRGEDVLAALWRKPFETGLPRSRRRVEQWLSELNLGHAYVPLPTIQELKNKPAEEIKADLEGLESKLMISLRVEDLEGTGVLAEVDGELEFKIRLMNIEFLHQLCKDWCLEPQDEKLRESCARVCADARYVRQFVDVLELCLPRGEELLALARAVFTAERPTLDLFCLGHVLLDVIASHYAKQPPSSSEDIETLFVCASTWLSPRWSHAYKNHCEPLRLAAILDGWNNQRRFHTALVWLVWLLSKHDESNRIDDLLGTFSKWGQGIELRVSPLTSVETELLRGLIETNGAPLDEETWWWRRPRWLDPLREFQQGNRVAECIKAMQSIHSSHRGAFDELVTGYCALVGVEVEDLVSRIWELGDVRDATSSSWGLWQLHDGWLELLAKTCPEDLCVPEFWVSWLDLLLGDRGPHMASYQLWNTEEARRVTLQAMRWWKEGGKAQRTGVNFRDESLPNLLDVCTYADCWELGLGITFAAREARTWAPLYWEHVPSKISSQFESWMANGLEPGAQGQSNMAWWVLTSAPSDIQEKWLEAPELWRDEDFRQTRTNWLARLIGKDSKLSERALSFYLLELED